jgi:hypothetical protein
VKPDFGFYSLLAVVGSFALFSVVAAFRREPFLPAQKKTLAFFDSYLQGLPSWALNSLRVVGGTTGFLLIVAIAYGFDSLGNAELERTKRFMAAHERGLDYLTWQVDNVQQWRSDLGRYRAEWSRENPKKDWEEHNSVDLKKWQCRWPRTLFWFSLLLILAGIVDSALPGFRKRGLAVLASGIVFTIITLVYYANRENHYIYEVLIDNQSLTNPVAMPQTLGNFEQGSKTSD